VTEPDDRALPEGVLAVRAGPGANCSSIGSVVDMLFVASVAIGTAYAAIAVALGDPLPVADASSDPSREPSREPSRDASKSTEKKGES
jgi:hypothetical protein